MLDDLKLLSPEALPRALEKADRYRLLNEPVLAESICLDILAVDAENQEALRILVLALSDQFSRGYKMGETDPATVITRLTSLYDRAYFTGIVAERRAMAILDQNAPHSDYLAYDLLTAAMESFEQAAEVREAGNDDALLRWNTCARLIHSHGVKARTEDLTEQFLE
jgi:hypothetical protein